MKLPTISRPSNIVFPLLLALVSPFSTNGFQTVPSLSSRVLVAARHPTHRPFVTFSPKLHSPTQWTQPQDHHHSTTALASSAVAANLPTDDDKLPSTVTPILLTVLALIISEGIALSTLPLHLQSLGASPVQVGMSTSAFSVAQMVMCPLIVKLSSKPSIGRRKTLSLCLCGAALSSLVIASSKTLPLLILARFLAGAFAAAIPVAQAGVVDLVPPNQNTLALSRVSAASQTGLVIGPIASAVVQSILRKCGVASQYLVRGVFVFSAAFALMVLAIRGDVQDAKPAFVEEEEDDDANKSEKGASDDSKQLSAADTQPATPKYIQPTLRIIALAAGWALTLSVAIYSLFASRFLGYGQSQLSLTYSAGAATVIATQMAIVPPLAKKAGVHLSCTLGLWCLACGLLGASLVKHYLPYHVFFYLLIRVGQGITDTSTATLVAKASRNKDERANNLGMIQSTRAGARIFTPIISGSLFTKSCHAPFPSRLAGTLPYLINAVLALGLSPLPMVLKRMSGKGKDEKDK